MLEFILLMVILDILSKIIVGEKECYAEQPKRNKYDNGTAEAYINNNLWEFKSLDDCMEFRELRLTGWKGNAKDFYEWKKDGY